MSDILEVMADSHRRRLLDHLSSTSENRCSVSELADAIRSEADGTVQSKERVRQRLIHVHLPKLSELGLIEHDEGSNEVRYVESTPAETVLDQIQSDSDGDSVDGGSPDDDSIDADTSGDGSVDGNS
ncbi:helix-turn-helix domain-containing protein [Haladaptatus sp. AB643]|uniref:winged helix-turn-helix domain-containing protein n=1 Tax=unclassified Haladaptatus TaxID=2622732 RepID=UPI00209BE694|nr:winged helix-turn-helix domain-containing protein [Haladaptatus sp. AB643]MCO8252958.1 winged helix-turn-helix domain-containing protein [Haladaptatus sp. AB618]